MGDIKKHKCESCAIRLYAERTPASWVARLWRWHTRWCPGWKAYQKSRMRTAE